MGKSDKYNLTCEAVAEQLSYNLEYVRKLASKGKLPAVKHKGRWWFNVDDIQKSSRTQNTREKDKANAEGDNSIDDLLL